MTTRECYEKLGEDYDAVVMRLGKEERVEKFFARLKDMPAYDELLAALDAGDYETAFRCSHDIKGLSANLGIDKFYKASSELCETMRNGKPTVDISGMLENVKSEYERLAGVLAELD